MDLKNKKVLLIAPLFFGYENDIRKEFEKCGAKVCYVAENLDHINLRYKIMCTMPSFIRERFIRNYFLCKSIVQEKWDLIFVIRGRWLNTDILKRLKEESACPFIMYQWDGAVNVPNVHEIESYFDKVFSFDQKDCAEYGWEYRPLFFAEEFENVKKTDPYKYDLLYTGSLHSGRAAFLKKVQDFAEEKALMLKHYLFMKKLNFLKRRYLHREYSELGNGEIQHKSLNRNQLIALMEESRCIVDYTNEKQTGLTMRTIECLGAKKKLITNNAYVKNEKMYDAENIYVYKDSLTEIPDSFLENEYKEAEKSVYEYYSVAGWLSDILSKI